MGNETTRSKASLLLRTVQEGARLPWLQIKRGDVSERKHPLAVNSVMTSGNQSETELLIQRPVAGIGDDGRDRVLVGTFSGTNEVARRTVDVDRYADCRTAVG